MAYTTESFTIDGVNFKDIQCYGKNNPTANGETSMIRQWIKQKYPKYSGVDAVSVSNSKYAGGHSISVNFNRLPEEDFDKIREELIGFFKAGSTYSGYHYTRTSKNYTATNGETYNIGILYIGVQNNPKYGSSASKNPAPDWSSMSTPTTSTTKGGFKKYPTRKEFGNLIRQCAGWDIYQKDGTTYLKKQKDTEPNKDKWNEILGTLNTQEGFFWRRTLQAFERNVILTEAQLDSVCNLLSKYYNSKSEPTAQAEPTPTTTEPTSTFPPKYFIVLEDGSIEFKEYIDWLNKTYKVNYEGNYPNHWYGVDNDDKNNPISFYDKPFLFLNNPQQFTAKDFMDKLKASGNYNPYPTTQPTITFPPKYFVVEADKSDDFIEFVNWGQANNYYFNIDKNDINNREYYWKYYGFDGQDYRMDMTNYRPSGNKPEVFTAKEFMDKLRASGNKTTTSDKELFQNQINKLKKLASISSKEDAQLFNNQIEKLNKLLKLLN
jgi:hypothetical protein